MTPDLAQRLCQFIVDEIAIGFDDIDANTDLLLTGAVDSLGVIRITHWFDDELDIEVDPIDVTLENFQTVGQMVAYAERRKAEAPES